MKSIIQEDDTRCYICGCQRNLERHHAMSGSNRKLAEVYGLTVMLCADHHRGSIGVHSDYILKERIEKDAQRAFEQRYGHTAWMSIFRKNYLK